MNSWDQIEKLFLEAAELPHAERAAFLDQSCEHDEELRREVESLLASDLQSGEKITRVLEEAAQSLLGLNAIIGTRLGSYRVVREIGRGGMGAVYLAVRDDAQFQKNVAIKLVKRGMDTTEVIRRFQHERQILAALDHPYIARLLDAGTAADGRPFFVMEYVEGEPIDTYCRDRSLSIDDRSRLFVKVCQAVSHAHRNLVIHRDLKPGNIFVTPDGSPKLLDFGVAKLLAPDADPGLTVTGMRSQLLTPQYASPEQVMGGPVNTTTDVYALGGVLFEILTGVCAQAIDTNSPEELERVVCRTDTIPPSAARPGIPADLDNIVMMAMRKDPARRYQSVDQLAEDIERYLDGRPVLARKDSMAYRAGKFVRRNRLMLIAGGLIVASLIGGIVAATYQARRAEQRLQNMVELANRSLFDVHSAIERLPGATEARRAIVKTTLEYLENLSKDAGRDEHLRQVLAAAYFKLADVQGYHYKPNLGDTKGAIDSYQKAAAFIEPIHAKHPNDPELLDLYVDIYSHMASTYDALGETPNAVKAFETGIPVSQNLIRLRPNDKNANQQLGVLYNDLSESLVFSDPARAYEYAQKHLDMMPEFLRKFPDDDDILDEAANAHAAMLNLLLRKPDLKRGLEEAKQCVELREKTIVHHPNDTVRLRNLMIGYGHIGAVLGLPLVPNLGDTEGARKYYDKCVEIARRLVKADPEDRTAQYDLASALMRRGAIDGPAAEAPQSIAALNESIAILEPLYHADPAIRYPRALATAYELAGYRMRDSGRGAEGIAMLERSIAISEAIFVHHPGEAPSLSQYIKGQGEISGMMIANGNVRGAIAHAERAVDIAQKYLNGPEHPLRVWYLGNGYYYLARAHAAQKNWSQAKAEVDQALANMNAPGGTVPRPKTVEEANTLLAEINSHVGK